jgi:hypothetical protein
MSKHLSFLMAAAVIVLAARDVDGGQAAARRPTMAPVSVAVPTDYVIGPEDVLGVVFWRETELTGDVTVRPDGRVSLPMLGEMAAAGLRPQQLQEQILAAAKKYLQDPNVAVVVRTINSMKVYVTGRVTTPGAQHHHSSHHQRSDREFQVQLSRRRPRQEARAEHHAQARRHGGRSLIGRVMIALSLLTAVFLLIAVSPAGAQNVTGPQGAAGGIFGGHRPIDPNRSSQRLSMDVDLSGGYDSAAEGIVAGDPVPLLPSYAGTVQTGIRYRQGKATRFFEASTRGRVNYESRTDVELVGGEAFLQGSTSIGRRLQLAGGGLINYDPATLAGQFAPAIGERQAGVGPDHHPPGGMVQQPWLASAGYFNLFRTWSRRQTTTAEYRTSRREPIDSPGLESHSQHVFLLHNWNFRPNGGFRMSYRFDDNRQAMPTFTMPPLRTSTADLGLRLQRRFSSIRALVVEFSGGAAIAKRPASVDANALEYVVPIGGGSVNFNLTGVWSLMIEGTRDITVLEGVTPEPFATNTATLQIDAAPTNRITLGISGTYSKGAGLATRTGAFETASVFGQVRYGLGRCCGVFTSYGFYNHRLHDLLSIPVGFPEQYYRHVGRVGFTWWLPLYGSF